ncbi:F0F1 ATP synthase subunit gamma [Thiomonas sp. FB-Cd]|uniref:F0F1 ATP synthase subunit gamma n=1 Tax=Thiomonas sp. FB-Cd TaxID=1158292 RepID=UPI0004DF46D3|nr:F0F1 ATP synthase subunit gamma [Thiomonas sp. FB-Cd]
MTERFAEISARIADMRQLGVIVNAMRGIAAARAQQARNQLAAVDSYAATLAAAIGRIVALAPPAQPADARHAAGKALVVFGAEQGFAGAFSERVFETIGAELGGCELFLVGTRASTLAAERGLNPVWTDMMPSHSLGVPRLAEHITEALYRRMASTVIDSIEVVFSLWQPGRSIQVIRRSILPLDLSAYPHPAETNLPILNLDPEALLRELTAGDLHAQLCHAALHAFAAENEARMEAMAAAHRQIERQLTALEATQRQVRQEEITAEIIELAAGETASRFAEGPDR